MGRCGGCVIGVGETADVVEGTGVEVPLAGMACGSQTTYTAGQVGQADAIDAMTRREGVVDSRLDVKVVGTGGSR